MIRFLSLRTALALGAAAIGVSPAAAQYFPAGGWYRGAPVAGYTVRASGFYSGPGLPPMPGGFEYYSPGGRPTVTVADPWGRVANVPLRPKVLYYSDQFLTPGGAFYPTHVVVIPDDRRSSRTVRPTTPPTANPPTANPPTANPPTANPPTANPPSTTPPAYYTPPGYYTPPASSREAIPAPKAARPPVREGAPPPKAQPPGGEVAPPLPAPAKTAPPPPAPGLPSKSAVPDRSTGSAPPPVPELPRLPDVPTTPSGSKPVGDKGPNLGPAPLDAPPPRPGK